jgi:UDP-glucuronate decarboxylase
MKFESLDPVVVDDTRNLLSTYPASKRDIMVVGAAGMLGSYITAVYALSNAIAGNDKEVFGFLRSKNPFLELVAANTNLKLFDISELGNIARKRENIHVIHAASPASFLSHQKNKKDMIESNILLTHEICQFLGQNKGHLTYLSSGEVYGDNPIIPTSENDYSSFDHLSLRGSYPESKRMAELLIQTWTESDAFSSTSLRLYHTFGPGIKHGDDRIFAVALESLLKNQNIHLNSRGSATRSFMYTLDLVTAIFRTVDHSGFSVFNVCADAETSILDFVNIAKSLNQKISIVINDDIEIEKISNVPSPIKRGAADNSKLKRTGWEISVTLERALEITLESMYWREKNL